MKKSLVMTIVLMGMILAGCSGQTEETTEIEDVTTEIETTVAEIVTGKEETESETTNEVTTEIELTTAETEETTDVVANVKGLVGIQWTRVNEDNEYLADTYEFYADGTVVYNDEPCGYVDNGYIINNNGTYYALDTTDIVTGKLVIDDIIYERYQAPSGNPEYLGTTWKNDNITLIIKADGTVEDVNATDFYTYYGYLDGDTIYLNEYGATGTDERLSLSSVFKTTISKISDKTMVIKKNDSDDGMAFTKVQ